MPQLTAPSSSTIGETVDAIMDGAAVRVTFLSAEALRIEPNDVCAIVGPISMNGFTTFAITGPVQLK
jgi:hypothetical protein